MEKEKMSVFKTLNNINVNEHTEKKGNLTYLSWAWAWSKVKENYPEAFYTVYENADGWNYHTDGKTAWVKTGVTIEGLEHIEYLPVMDFRNNSIPVDNVTSFNVNTAIQRSLTKAVARHGLGLYIYAGEDLPEVEQPEKKLELEEATEQELDTFEQVCAEHGVDCKEVWRQTGKVSDKSKAHLGKAQLWLVNYNNAQAKTV